MNRVCAWSILSMQVALAACATAVNKDDNYLTDVGMFYVGGGIAEGASEHSNQALVHYFKAGGTAGVPVIMYPGLGLSSYIYISTPDGRQGWAQQFATSGHATYVYDPVDTGPSGFPASAFRGDTPASVSTWDVNQIWPRWGFGERRDQPYENVRFPVEQIDQFYASWPPRLASGNSGGMSAAAGGQQFVSSSKDVAALVALLEKTGPAVLMPHSMGGTTVFEVAASRPDLVKGLVAIEPVGCPRSNDAVANWTSVPFLAVYGDYVDERGQTSRRDACNKTVQLINDAGGNGSMIELTKEGVFGNTHLMMQDNNSAAIAARILAWIDTSVD